MEEPVSVVGLRDEGWRRVFPARGGRGLHLALAAVAASLLCLLGCPRAAQAPYDSESTELNLNLTALNPKWHSQVSDNVLPAPSLCGGGKPYNPPCTTQATWEDNDFTCSDGHHNWSWATFDGTAFWDSHSCPVCDDDYNVSLVRADQASYTQANPASLLMEFDSDITIDHFDHPDDGWWRRFHSAVDQDDNAARAFLDGKQVIALGLLGLDCEHSCGSELHPVVALAIHVNADINDDHWAVFAMNWGDEGWCSSGYERFPDVLPVSFLLPWNGATGVEVLPTSYMYGRGVAGTQWGVDLRGGTGAELWFRLPDPGSDPDDSGERLHGEVHLRWTSSNAAAGARGPMAAAPPPASSASTERAAAELIRKMTPDQKAIFDRLVPAKRAATGDQTLVGPVREKPKLPSARPPLNRSGRVRSATRDERRRQIIHALSAAYGGTLPSELGTPRSGEKH